MDEGFLSGCKAALSNLLSSDTIKRSDDPFTAFSSAIMNFYSHYCLDEHSSEWCHHNKVCSMLNSNKAHHHHFFSFRRWTDSHTRPNIDLPVGQMEKFYELLECMAARPQDYVSLGGRMTTNSVEGFHGLALMYRDKRTDLGHTHFICKTNMAICHKVRNSTQMNNAAKYMMTINAEPWSNLEAPLLCKDGG